MSEDPDIARQISIVIPVLNEAESLVTLHAQIAEVLAGLPERAEVIFVDDGSTDETWPVLARLQESDPRVSAIRFRRNFGKAAALAAGFALASGQRVLTLDADLQDDPREIPRFLEQIDQGYDVVCGWKKSRKDPWHKTVPSRFFNALVSWLTGVRLHDHNCGFKCFHHAVLKEIRLYGELHRFIPVLAAARGFRVGEIVVHHRPRQYGHSKYGFERFARGFVDLLTVKFLTSYQHRPQHLLGSVGIASMVLGFAGIAYLSMVWLLNAFGGEWGPIGQRPLLLLSATAMLFGVQLITVGFIAELVTARNPSDEPVYSIAESRLSACSRAPTASTAPSPSATASEGGR